MNDSPTPQASVAMGIMLGYVCAGLIVTYVGAETCHPLSCDALDLDCLHDDTHGGHEGCFNPRWRIPLYIQAFGVLAFAPLFAYVKVPCPRAPLASPVRSL